MSPSPDVVVGAGDLAARYHAEIRHLYDEVFLRPPFLFQDGAAEAHEAELLRLRADATFTVAVGSAGARIAGFAYGHRLPVDHRWWGRFPTPLDEELTREWEGRTFAVVDLAVRPGLRRRGWATRLLGALLASRDEERAVLSVQPDATAAHALYLRTGWRLVGRKGPIPGTVPPYWDIYLRELPPPRR
ncbi:GNAT family N-acetyltransferase [Marinactinospora thermotolerans]|uniref:Acetyltransferases n=1 Tax=Marinactinospora thermotolerans DSM 45154 TaxID=1122192 RepID=A0A1T4TCQ1_9ACTN|nr:GNAT family N-acetyltransferase [Marinactinospora thermotolerans]SKA37989.1 Acetyltransferases [Marinactinospora thermotolerans DSM 45154]